MPTGSNACLPAEGVQRAKEHHQEPEPVESDARLRPIKSGNDLWAETERRRRNSRGDTKECREPLMQDRHIKAAGVTADMRQTAMKSSKRKPPSKGAKGSLQMYQQQIRLVRRGHQTNLFTHHPYIPIEQVEGREESYERNEPIEPIQSNETMLNIEASGNITKILTTFAVVSDDSI